ncbi:MAG: hypothetical protein ABEK17_04090 [Candidatus Aenigmatarchaeota archaeon]
MNPKKLKIFATILIFLTFFTGSDVRGFSHVKFNLEFSVNDFDFTDLDSYYSCMENRSSNYFTGWSFGGKIPRNTEITSQGENIKTSITINKKSDTSSGKSFFVLSRGKCMNMEKRKNIISNREFLGNNYPSFSYKMPQNYYLRVLLDYNKLDIINDQRFSKGKHKISIDYVNDTEDKISMKFDVQ